MSRTAERGPHFSDAQRIALAEKDLDEHDGFFDAFKTELGKMKGIMLGILVSTTTAAILLALNLVAKA